MDSINGQFTRDNVDPHFIGQLLAALRGSRAQRKRILDDLNIMRRRPNWTELDWQTVNSLHRQLDTVNKQIEATREALERAGAHVE